MPSPGPSKAKERYLEMTIREALNQVWFAIRPRETCSQFGECNVTCPICHQSSRMHAKGCQPNPLVHRDGCAIPFLEEFLHGGGLQNYDVTLRFGSMLQLTDVDAHDPVEAIEKVLSNWSSTRPMVPLAVSAQVEGLDEQDEREPNFLPPSDMPVA